LTLACLQDLSQARARWGPAADGFFSLFGTKVLLPGIGDMMTLDAVSRLAGQADVVVRSVNSSALWTAHPTASTTRSPRQPGPVRRCQNGHRGLTLKWRGVPGQRRLHPPPPRL
jgi:type IV secretory pathway TraG/TraD family ATPase VirD4